MIEVRVLYLCDGKACGETCPNEDCHHTNKYAHALHKDADPDSFMRVPGPTAGSIDLWEPYDGE